LSFLVDTNIISELRKNERCNASVSAWYETVLDEDVFLSVLTVGEIRRGIENIRRRDVSAAHTLEAWFNKVLANHSERILPVTDAVAEEWGRLNVPNQLPVIDGLLAATAKVHGLTLVTRNVSDVEAAGIPIINPFRARV
jgi:predicted nucleic acid-binding protein